MPKIRFIPEGQFHVQFLIPDHILNFSRCWPDFISVAGLNFSFYELFLFCMEDYLQHKIQINRVIYCNNHCSQTRWLQRFSANNKLSWKLSRNWKQSGFLAQSLGSIEILKLNFCYPRLLLNKWAWALVGGKTSNLQEYLGLSFHFLTQIRQDEWISSPVPK